MKKIFYFCVKGARSGKSHVQLHNAYYEVTANAILSAWRKVRETDPHGTIFALKDNAKERYHNKQFTPLIAED